MKMIHLYVPFVFHPFHILRKVVVARLSDPFSQSTTCHCFSHEKQGIKFPAAILEHALHVLSDFSVRTPGGIMDVLGEECERSSQEG